MAAAYILGINMFVAAIFAVAFSVVAAVNPEFRSARLIAMGYATGIVNVVLEFMLVGQSDPLLVSIGCFLVYLLAVTLCFIGLSLHYGVRPPMRVIGAIFGVSAIGSPFLLSLPYDSMVRAVLYQVPYFLVQSLFVWMILKSGRRGKLDMLLLALQALASIIYLARPAIALWIGMVGKEQQYMASSYGAVSQTLGSLTLIGLALVILLVMMRDSATLMSERSETDALSGVLNRRGFYRQAGQTLAEARRDRRPAVLIAADLDHFKRVNDSYGHAVGDAVIVHFANVLRTAMGVHAVVGRLGGEEFSVLVGGAALTEGGTLAETARRIFQTSCAAEVGLDQQLTASFGVIEIANNETLECAATLADKLLYAAKARGRNCVEPPFQPQLAIGDVLTIGEARGGWARERRSPSL